MKAEIQFVERAIVIPPAVLPSREIGSCLEFSGIVREMEGTEALPGLYYEAYEPMARRLLERHFAEIAAAHPVAEVVFIHRLGWVPTGEASLFLRVLSSHRAEGLEFLAAAVIRLKQDVPVWKLTRPPGLAPA
jgi:molybdopterin synthase catalytic subunit